MDEEAAPELIDITESTNDNIPSSDIRKVPVTLITGYLGSGKSTLLQHILSAAHGRRIAVVLNEFGDSMDIEKASLVKSNDLTGESSATIEEWIELKNGCMCCSVKDAGVKAIENLLLKKKSFDYILVETTGLAKPGSIISMFWLDEELQASIFLDGVIAVVDCKYAAGRFADQEGREFITQIAAADRIIMNKADLVSENEVMTLRDQVAGVNSITKTIVAERGVVPLEEILDLRAYTGDSIPEYVSREPKTHDSRITTASFSFDGTINIEVFERWLEELLWEKRVDDSETPINVIRLKAAITSTDGVKYLYQAVCESYDKNELPRTSELRPKIVFIGENIVKGQLENSFISKVQPDREPR